MNKGDVKIALREHALGVADSDFGIRFDGGNQDADLPEIVIGYSETRTPERNGHNSFGGYVTDSNDIKVGIEYHGYWSVEVEFAVRSYRESAMDQTINDIVTSFLPFEYDAREFHVDTEQWEVGEIEPRHNAVVEPDWYENAVIVRFNYLKRQEVTGMDTIENIPKSVDAE